MSFAKWRLFCLGLNVLTGNVEDIMVVYLKKNIRIPFY